MLGNGNVLSDLQWSETLSELAKETAAGKTLVFQVRGNNSNVSLHPQNRVRWSTARKSFAEDGI